MNNPSTQIPNARRAILLITAVVALVLSVGATTLVTSSTSYANANATANIHQITRCSFEFTNATRKTVSIYWYYYGRLKHYKDLSPGKKLWVSTYNGLVWKFYHGREKIGSHKVDCRYPKHKITGGDDGGGGGGDGGSCVTLYKHIHFSGESRCFGTGEYKFHDLNPVGDNQASSIKIPHGCRVQACSKYPPGGHGNHCKDWSSSVADFRRLHFNDKLSWMRVSCPTPPELPKVNIGSVEVDEDDGRASVTISLSSAASRTCRLTVASRDGSATSGQDYESESQSISFAPGEREKTISFDIIDDSIDEAREMFDVIGSNADGCRLGDNGKVTIIDNDEPEPTPTIDVGSTTVDESDGIATVDVRLSSAISTICRVTVSSRDGSANSGEDYETNSEVIEFAPGETRKSISFSITNDDQDEPDETFRVVQNDSNESCNEGSDGTVTILDDDEPEPIPVINVGSSRVDESAGTATVDVVLSEAISRVCRVTVFSRDGSAVSGEDYATNSEVIEFAPGETRKSISFSITNDDRDEPDESFGVIQGNTSTSCDNGSDGTVTILDDDEPEPIPVINVGSSRVDESAGTATVDVVLSEAISRVCRVTVFSRDGSAVSGEDYATNSEVIEFAPGETRKSISFSITNDDRDEPDESFGVIQGNTSTSCDNGSDGTVTILDDDDAPVNPIVNVGSTEVDEDAGAASVRVTLSEPSNQACSVRIATQDGSAQDGSDYVGASRAVTFAPGETEKVLTYTIVDDTVVEPTEQFVVVIASIQNCRRGSEGTVTINDNDVSTPVPVVNVGSVTVTEGDDDVASVEVTLSEPTTVPVTVRVASRQNGTAISGSDYNGRDIVVVFAPGETSKIVSWGIIDDEEQEPTESFVASIQSADNADIGSNGLVTILDDDDAPPQPTPIVNAGSVEVNENSGNATVGIQLSTPSREVCTLSVSSRDGSAESGSDYTGGGVTLTFQPGETNKAVRFPILDDSVPESTETFGVLLSNASASCEIGQNGTVTINDDDAR